MTSWEQQGLTEASLLSSIRAHALHTGSGEAGGLWFATVMNEEKPRGRTCAQRGDGLEWRSGPPCGTPELAGALVAGGPFHKDIEQ